MNLKMQQHNLGISCFQESVGSHLLVIQCSEKPDVTFSKRIGGISCHLSFISVGGKQLSIMYCSSHLESVGIDTI